MATALILGGGFGGVATAVALRELLPADDEVILVDRRADFVMGLRKTWHLLGVGSVRDGSRQLATLEHLGISVRRAEIASVNPAQRSAALDGVELHADALVVALGTTMAPDAVPGLRDHAIMAWDRDEADAGRDAIEAFAARDGGRAVVGIFGTPYPCPPAPYELALLLRDRLAADDRFSVEIFTPTPISLPVLGAAECSRLDARLAQRGIGFRASTSAVSVGAESVRLADGGEIPFDLLLAVSPHRVPSLLVDAGMAAEGGWVQVNRATLETRWPGVYAIGDCTAVPLSNGLALPKAGLMAQLEGETVARRIAGTFRGDPPTAEFEGVGSCFVEMGGGEAAVIRGDFYAAPPSVTLSDSSPDVMTDKLAFETERLAAWFGH